MDIPATDLIIGSTIIVTGTTMLRQAEEKKGSPLRTLMFGFFLASALLAISFVGPSFAKTLALLAIVGAFAVNGPAVFKLASKV